MQNTLERINNVCLVILAITAMTAALIYTKAALVPLVFSIFIYAIASPGVDYFQRKLKLSKWLAIGLTIVLFLLISTLLIFFIISSIDSFLSGASAYEDRIQETFSWVINKLGEHGISTDKKELRDKITKLPLFSWVQSFTGSLFGLVGNISLVIIFVLFLLAGQGSGSISSPLVDEIFSKISRYVAIKFLNSFLTGVLVFAILAIAGVELAFMFGVITVILNFIPSIGSIIATLVPLPVILLQFGFGPQFLIVLILTGAVQFVVGNVLEPKMMGENMDLHPVTVLVFLIFWGLVWGVPGMFLATPITAILKIVCSKIETTKTFAELLAGRVTA